LLRADFSCPLIHLELICAPNVARHFDNHARLLVCFLDGVVGPPNPASAVLKAA